MACELWVRGTAHFTGPQYIDRFCRTWPSALAVPTLTVIQVSRGITFYSVSPSVSASCVSPGFGWYTTPEFYTKGCEGLPLSLSFDCLNGGCVGSGLYGTPGVYQSLAACQSGCAKNSTCTGECVSSEELAALQQAAANVRPRFCG